MKVIIICPKCNGSGKVSSNLAFIKYQKACPRCKGDGKVNHRMKEYQRT